MHREYKPAVVLSINDFCLKYKPVATLGEEVAFQHRHRIRHYLIDPDNALAADFVNDFAAKKSVSDVFDDDYFHNIIDHVLALFGDDGLDSSLLLAENLLLDVPPKAFKNSHCAATEGVADGLFIDINLHIRPQSEILGQHTLGIGSYIARIERDALVGDHEFCLAVDKSACSLDSCVGDRCRIVDEERNDVGAGVAKRK